MKILITGGCGFLGTNIGERILEQNIGELFVLDNLSRLGGQKNLEYLYFKGLKNFFNIDIVNTKLVEDLISRIKPDYIFHLAGQVAMTTSIENPIRDFEINVIGTLNVLESIRKYNLGSIIVYSSTNKVYGDLERYSYSELEYRYVLNEFPNGLDENTQMNFHSPYGCSKGTADQYLLDYYRMYGIKTVVFRHSSMYGGRQFSTFDQGWTGWFCQKALEKKRNIHTDPFTISGNGKQVRDLLFASDAVDLYLSVIGNIEKLQGLAFNIGGGFENSMSLLELFEFLEINLDVELKYNSLPKRISDQKVFIADIRYIQSLINWKPKVNFREGILKSINWIQTYE